MSVRENELELCKLYQETIQQQHKVQTVMHSLQCEMELLEQKINGFLTLMSQLRKVYTERNDGPQPDTKLE
jgi:hypothetical protein